MFKSVDFEESLLPCIMRMDLTPSFEAFKRGLWESSLQKKKKKKRILFSIYLILYLYEMMDVH